MTIFYLACRDDTEAQKIGQAILEAKQAVCVRRWPINSSYWWDGAVQHSQEVLLMIESEEEQFDKLNQLIGTLHSYKDYVLTMVPVVKTTPGVTSWLDETLGA